MDLHRSVRFAVKALHHCMGNVQGDRISFRTSVTIESRQSAKIVNLSVGAPNSEDRSIM